MLKFLERKKDIKPEPIKEKPLSEMSSEEALQATVVARGLGSTIGLAIILAILFFILQHIVMLNLPFISDLITKMIYTVQENLRYFQGGTF